MNVQPSVDLSGGLEQVPVLIERNSQVVLKTEFQVT